MIISASRRTDIPAFYADWMMNRIRAGFCAVPNPFNRKQVSRISLLPADVDVIVFWTRNPGPLLRYLDEIDSAGLRYYFQFTILGYPREIDPGCPSLSAAIGAFRRLASHVGSSRVVWRYDPIVFTEKTRVDYHKQQFARIAGELAGYTQRVVVSIVDSYRKTETRMESLTSRGAGIIDCDDDELARLMAELSGVATATGLDITSCAEDIDLSPYGIPPGKCVDDRLIADVFGLDVSHEKDSYQRARCGCVNSRDIGMYDSCSFGCPYCYATQSFERARENRKHHDPASPSLLGWYEP